MSKKERANPVSRSRAVNDPTPASSSLDRLAQVVRRPFLRTTPLDAQRRVPRDGAIWFTHIEPNAPARARQLIRLEIGMVW